MFTGKGLLMFMGKVCQRIMYGMVFEEHVRHTDYE